MVIREDDERSIAGDSWSVKSEYGSTLDGDDGPRTYELTLGGLTIAEGGSPPRAVRSELHLLPRAPNLHVPCMELASCVPSAFCALQLFQSQEEA